MAVRGVAADEDQHQDDRDQPVALHRGDARQAVEKEEADRDRDDVGDDDGPDHGVGDRDVLGQHVRPGNQAEQQKTAEQDRHRGAAGDAEGDGRNQRAAFLGVVRRARSEHAAYVTLAELLALLRGLGALRRMAVRHPLRDRAAQPGHDADEGADEAAADRQPEMAKGVLDAFPRALGDLAWRRVAGDRVAAHKQVDDLRNGEDADQHRDEIQPLPEIERVEGRPMQPQG